MRRRLISGALVGLAMTVLHAPVALAHGGAMPGESILSGNSMFLPFTTAFVAGVIGYTLMVWDPRGARK